MSHNIKCNVCQDKGLIVILAKDYEDPIFDNAHARCALPHYGNKPIVLDCECHYDNPLSDDKMVDMAMTFLEDGMYPYIDTEVFNGWN